MNYRHSYHAGNFADVFKHIILIELIKSFLKKDTPFCYLETHAGIGSYDLQSETTQKSKEYEQGVAKIIENPNELVNDYLQIIRQFNPDKKLRFYPGSPFFAKEFLRDHDRMILSELHPEECQTLKKFCGHNKQIAIHCQDGYQSLKAFLPPHEKRGLVLIDPPYEKSNEFEQLLKIIPETVKRWETGVYALWYPIKNRAVVNRFLNSLREKIKRPSLVTELMIYPDDIAMELNGCGMFLINPPWQLQEKLEKILPWLWQILRIDNQGYFKIEA